MLKTQIIRPQLSLLHFALWMDPAHVHMPEKLHAQREDVHLKVVSTSEEAGSGEGHTDIIAHPAACLV